MTAQEQQVENDEEVFAPPPFGPQPSWILNSYADEQWLTKMRGRTTRVLDFTKIPINFRLNAKYLLWALEYVQDSRYNRIPPKSSQAFIAHFYEYRRMTYLLEERGFQAFRDVPAEHVRGLYLERMRDASKQKPSRSQATTYKVRSFFQRLYTFGPALTGIIPDGFTCRVDPLDVDCDLTPIRAPQSTLIIPEKTACRILRTAMDFCESYGDAIIRLFKLNREFVQQESWRSSGCELHERRSNFIVGAGQSFWACWDLDAISALRELEGLRAMEAQSSKVLHPDIGLMTSANITLLLSHLIAACYIVIAGFTGFRVSEVLTMKPDAIVARGGRNYVRTCLSKSRMPEDVVCERLGPPIVAKTLPLVLSIAAIFGCRDRVWVNKKGHELTYNAIASWLLRFERQVIKCDWHLRSHELRRFMAIILTRRFKIDEEAIQHQLGQDEIRIAQAYTRDVSTARFVMEEKTRLAREIVCDGSPYSFRPLDERFAYRAQNMSVKTIGEMVKGADSHIDLEANPWGYCLLQRYEREGAVCGGKNGERDLAGMTPETCIRCRHLAIGPENKSFWAAAKALHLSISDDKHATPRLKALSLAFVTRIDARMPEPTSNA